MNSPCFDIVLITRNEEKTLPRLFASLKEFQNRGGTIVICDTGSTDNTVALAREFGCKVEEVGDRFRTTISDEDVTAINDFFIRKEESPVVKKGDSFFDYAAARNYSTSLATKEWVWCIDADEQASVLNIDAINELCADDSLSRLEYQFVFSHDSNGNPALQFMHSKFYRRDRMQWTNCVHEVLADIGGQTTAHYVDESILFLEHFQQYSEHRSSYLIGLAYDCFKNQGKDRQSHYIAREMMYTGRYWSAIEEFQRHIDMNRWPAERAQSALYIGECYKQLKLLKQAEEAYHEAMQIDPHRREPFFALGELFHTQHKWQESATYFAAALSIPHHGGFYATDMSLYKERIHLLQSVNLYYLGKKEEALNELLKAYAYIPENDLVLSNFKYLIEFPPVSIVIPTLGERDLTALLDSLNADNYYGEKEILVVKDEHGEGCPKTLNRGVMDSRNPFVVFIGDDSVVEKNWLNHAMIAYQTTFKDTPGLVALNDGMHFDDWKPKLACHWLSHKSLLPFLENEQFFWEGVTHWGCDDVLTLQCQILGKLAYTPLAKITHTKKEDSCSQKALTTYIQDREITAKKLSELKSKYDRS